MFNAVYIVINVLLKTIIYLVVANKLLLPVSNTASDAGHSLWRCRGHRPCSHCQFYPTPVPFANDTRPLHTASTASGSSGAIRPHRVVFPVDANGRPTRRLRAAV